MTIKYSGYSAGWKPSESDTEKKYRAMLLYDVYVETSTEIIYEVSLYVDINSSVTASYSGTLTSTGGRTYTGTCETVLGEECTVVCIDTRMMRFDKGKTATTVTIQGSVKSSSGSWTGESLVASATLSIPALRPVTITFDANGGSGTVPTAISTYFGDESTIPSNSLTRTGYTFDSWNTASDGSGTAYATGSTIRPFGDVTLYAQWKTTYVKPGINNLVAFRTADASGGASPTIISTGTTGFCKFELVVGANYTVTSAAVRFGTAIAKEMTISGTTIYGYSDVGSIAEESAYTVKVTVVVTGEDGISRTYTDSTYISKATPVFDISSDGNCFSFFGPATDGLVNPKLIINGELEFSGGGTRTLLWTNAKPTSSFRAQKISLDLSGYDFVEVIYKLSTSSTESSQIIERCEIGAEIRAERFKNPTSTKGILINLYRGGDGASTSGYTFGAAYTKTANATGSTQDNTYMIPYKIYGIKEG